MDRAYTVLFLLFLFVLICVLLVVILIKVSKKNKNTELEQKLNEYIEQSNLKTTALETKMDAYFKNYGEMVEKNQRAMSDQQDTRLKSMEDSLSRMRNENTEQFESMRKNVDEKLEQVSKGLGEMQSVASNVGDLKKILSNVKTRGILGEVQLAAILEQILNKEQYEENVPTIKGSSERVEFAIRLPGDGNEVVYLPIDSKFPGETYAHLMEAYELGDKTEIDSCKKLLRNTMRAEAKDIKSKYIAPPDTTDFGVMFLPFEGLYAEAVNMGMVEELQREFKVTIAGPTTMAALLNSLQMGFNTLAIEKKSSEVWKVLSEVKKEFGTFGEVLNKAQDRLNQTNKELDKLIGTRTNAINRKLRDVMLLEEDTDDNNENLLDI